MTRKHKILLGISWIGFVLLLFVTSPSQLPITGLILPFIFLSSAIYFTLCLILQKYTKLTEKKLKRFAVLGSVAIILTIALQSLGQLTVRDVIVACVIIALAYFYITRVSGKP